MVINDYYDREIDAVNEPGRPIPKGLIRPNEALTFASLLTLFGLLTAALTCTAVFTCFLTAVLFWLISVTYVTIGKKTGFLGNLLVSACVSAPFVYGSLAVANEVQIKIWIFVSMVFLSNTGREITKGIADVQGDKIRGVRTLAVRYGSWKASVAAAAFYLLAIALTPLPWILGLVNLWFVPLAGLTDVGLTLSAIMLLRNHSRENARKVKTYVLAMFFAGLIAFMVGNMG